MSALNDLIAYYSPAVFLRAQVPEGQRGHACDDHEHLRAAEGEHAGALLLRPQRAAGDRPPDAALWPRRHLPLAAVAVLHVHRRRRHHYDGEAHSVPLQAVWGDREDQEVKRAREHQAEGGLVMDKWLERDRFNQKTTVTLMKCFLVCSHFWNILTFFLIYSVFFFSNKCELNVSRQKCERL